MVVLVVRTFEGNQLVLEHRFFGNTEAEATRIYNAHRQYDKFLRECTTGKHPRFDNRVACRSESFFDVT